ncbi:tRNA1(Val) (adenine(37)-N6)-methyltransferase [Thiovibrio frasassiensis]|uniref:Methyltransferase n=1 Tax=Thiovibrio frasassiensis TaxID=2984131 RepID=A0A9X4MKS5_9BACT|nr:methyltransferase [Thiovibrio frasassiensis]MDG4474647.1 methyltransferase [Thiovibrio frasassiensis]
MGLVEELSEEPLFGGRLRCLQPLQGYRFSVDAVLLAHFITPPPGARILDLGGGCGIISLILSHRHPDASLVALEVQPRLAALIRGNVLLNGLENRITVLETDCREIASLLPENSLDYVTANPPYYPSASGRYNPESERARARHEILGGIAEMARAASYALKAGGRAAFVYPAAREEILLGVLRENGMTPQRLQRVCPYPGAKAGLVLVEAEKDGGEGLAVLPEFFICKEKGGGYMAAMAAMYAE